MREGCSLFCLLCCHYSSDHVFLSSLQRQESCPTSPVPPSAGTSLQVCSSESPYPDVSATTRSLVFRGPPHSQSYSHYICHYCLIPHKAFQALTKPRDHSEHQSTTTTKKKRGRGWGSTLCPAKPRTNVGDYCTVFQKDHSDSPTVVVI